MYKIIVHENLYKDIKKIPKSDIEKILKKISKLQETPRPSGFKKLKGQNNRYRIRQGNYRIVYDIREKEGQITILFIDHRKEIYFRLS